MQIGSCLAVTTIAGRTKIARQLLGAFVVLRMPGVLIRCALSRHALQRLYLKLVDAAASARRGDGGCCHKFVLTLSCALHTVLIGNEIFANCKHFLALGDILCTYIVKLASIHMSNHTFNCDVDGCREHGKHALSLTV